MFDRHWGKLLVVFQSVMCQIPDTLHQAISNYQLRFKHIFFSALQQTLAHSVTSPTAGDSSAPAATSCTLWTGRAGLRPDMTACRTEQTWCPLRQQMKSSSSRDRWTHHTLTSGLGFPHWWEEHGVTPSSSLCHLTLGENFSVHQCEDELCFSRNATRFPVRSRREMNSSPGLTLRRGITQTGALMNLQGKMSYCIYLPFEPEYLSVQSKLKHVF